MARVFFDLRVGDDFIRDLEGVEFEDLAAAKADAEASLHEMIAADVASQRPLQRRAISIRDEHGATLATVQVKARVAMVQETETDLGDDNLKTPTKH